MVYLFDWDERKREINLKNHHIDFVRAKEIWNSPTVEFESQQKQHGEVRHIAIGMLEPDLYVAVVFTWRDQKRRIISVRRARKNEKVLYDNAVG